MAQGRSVLGSTHGYCQPFHFPLFLASKFFYDFGFVEQVVHTWILEC